MSRGGSPAPSSTDDGGLAHRRPRSKGFIPGSNRGSNASQYDNVPGLPDQDFEILELERPPSRLRQARSETPFSVSSGHHGSPLRGPGLTGGVVPGPRGAPHQFPHANSPAGIKSTYPSHYHVSSHQQSPGRNPTEVPIFHPAHGLDPRGEDPRYAVPSRYTPSPTKMYGDRAYATAQRHANNVSPEKVFMNNFATYRRQPTQSSSQPPHAPRPSHEYPLKLDTSGTSTPIYLQQLTSAAQVYAPVGPLRAEPGPHYPPEDGHRRGWGEEELPPPSPGGMPRSPSFQKAQMCPVQEFTFPANSLHSYRAQLQAQPLLRQPLPQLFVGPHYRNAHEAFAMQDSMLL